MTTLSPPPQVALTNGAPVVLPGHVGAAVQRGRRARRARVLIAVVAVGIAWAAVPYFAGLVGAVVLYVLCGPAYRRLAARVRPGWAALIVTIAAALLLVAPAIGLVAMAVEEAPGALQHVVSSSLVAHASAVRIGTIDVGAQVGRAGYAAAAWASSRAVGVAGGLTRALLNLMIALVGLFYLLPAAGAFWRHWSSLVPFSAEGTESLRERFVSVTQATLLGIAATSVSQGLVVGLTFWAVGLPNPVVWGVVTAVTSILPILGSAIVWLPGVVVLAVDGRYGAALALGLVGALVASNVDNVVRPLVYRRVSNIHPMATLVGAFVGVELVGLPGLLIGPLGITYGLELVRLYRAEYGE